MAAYLRGRECSKTAREREKDRPFPALNDSAVADVLHHKNLLLLTLKDKWRSNAILFLKKQRKAL